MGIYAIIMEETPGGQENQESQNNDYRPIIHESFDLMKFQISRILLVSSLYDAFTLEEEGLLSEQISGKYQEMALSSPPRVSRVSTGEEALSELKQRQYDLIITMPRLIDIDPFEFGKRAKEIQPGVPVVLLVTDAGDLPMLYKPGRHDNIDKIFFWNGDSALFMAITKYVEDTMNVERDTGQGLVRIILVVEDSPRYYSIFLPSIYTEIVRQTQSLMAEGLNDHEKLYRKRARPKILLAENFEEAMEIYKKYKKQILGVITDVSYYRGGKRERDAGFQLVEEIDKDIPILIQSSHEECRKRANELGKVFLHKKSETLLQDLRDFFKSHLGFGDFIFLLPSGEHIGHASDMKEFIEFLETVPTESIIYHAKANHFSNWLMARGEMDLARKLRPKKVSDFQSDEEMRQYLLKAIEESRRNKRRGIITDFEQQNFEYQETFTRLGGGSLGGKGRGLAFLSSLLTHSDIRKKIKGCRIKIPDTMVIGTDEFDRFMEDNTLYDILNNGLSDDEIASHFLNASMSPDIKDSLRQYLSFVNWPLAVRSSSLLEDSQNQPFAGIYSTFMLPNNCPDEETRTEQLCQAIKLVYASAFYKSARAYIQSTVHITEEEKMAIVIQKMVGKGYGTRFYPLFSGVVQSINYYPVAPLKREDAIVSAALGLGRIVVEGEKVLNFSPQYPKILQGMSTPEGAMKNSQSHFYILNLDSEGTCFDFRMGEDITLLRIPVSEAEEDGTLNYLASTYVANDNRLRDGTGYPGPKLITFAGILNHKMIPLASIVEELLKIGGTGMGNPVEIEFAGTIAPDGKPEFYALQIRPLVGLRERKEVRIKEKEREKAFIHTGKALGNGILEGIRDILFIPPERFDNTRTLDIALEIGQVNDTMEGKPYLLIGPGRWGTRDRSLGIPVEWDQISWARAIVEASLEDFRIDPSHGTHFFHNITSLGIMYFSVPYGTKTAYMDWDWLAKHEPAFQGTHVTRIKLEQDLQIKVDGRSGQGIIAPASD